MERVFRMLIGTVLLVFLPVQAYSYTIDDMTNIGVGWSHDSGEEYLYTREYLGSGFQTAGIDVSFVGSIMTIGLYTKFDGSFTTSPVELLLADLFFDTGTGWDFAIDMNTYFSGSGILYEVVNSYTSEDKQ